MRRFYTLLPLLVGLLLPTATWADGDITIDATNFPDKAFRDFLTTQSYGEDGVLTENEITGVTEMYLTNKGISNLKGIEYFKNLYVLQCDSNQLTSLDLSSNTALQYLKCKSNKLTSLDITKNTALLWLDCWANYLTSLDVTQNTALYYLDCDGNKLKTLDVSNNVNLTKLYCPRNWLTTLDISHNTALIEFECMENKLTSLDVSHNPALDYLNCGNNKLTSINLSQNTALQQISVYSNQLTSLDVSKNTVLKRLDCRDNYLRGQDMDAFIASLPTVNAASIYVKNYNDNNECLSAQIGAIKAKGWTPYFSVVKGYSSFLQVMEEYETSKETIYTETIGDAKYMLSYEMTDKYTINANPEPEGGWFYKSKLMLDVEKDGTTESYLIDDQIFTGEKMDAAYVPSMLFDVDARKLYVFCTSKDSYHDYGMEGFIYESSLDDLQFTKNIVFNRANWGWYSGFMGLRNGRPVVTHWSFAGYIAMVSTCSAQGVWSSTQERSLPGHDDYIPIWQQQRHVLIVGNDYDWVTESQYQAALEAIPARSKFRIFTMFDSKKYYLTAAGTLSESIDDANDFLFSQAKSNSLFASPGWRLSVPFTNPLMNMSNGASGEIVNMGYLRTNDEKRSDWEGQVWFKKGDSYAVRSTNALSVTYGANTFWGVLDADSNGQPEAGYLIEPTYIWQLEDINSGIENLTSESSKANTIYNLAGQRQTTLQKGLNIVGRKKIMVR